MPDHRKCSRDPSQLANPIAHPRALKRRQRLLSRRRIAEISWPL
jgi:hypothetical protein